MSRPDLSRPPVTAAAGLGMATFHAPTVEEVRKAVERHDVVVVGMAWNPHVPQARKALTEAGLDHHYIGIGSYLSRWKQRLAVKLWTGWPTFPQVFVRGTFVGGASDVKAALADGSLHELLGERQAAK